MNGPQVIDPGLKRVGREAARRLQRNGLRAKGRVQLEAVTEEEIASLSGLLGSRWRAPQAGADASVDLAALDLALRDSWYGCTLADLATAAHGRPLVDARATRTAVDAARDAGWAALREHAALARWSALDGWIERERGTGAALRTLAAAGRTDPLISGAPDHGGPGVPSVADPSPTVPSAISLRLGMPGDDRTAGDGDRVPDPFALLRAVLDLTVVLPADPPTSLVRFATERCGGDPHALDRGRPLDAVLRRALAHLDEDDAPATGAAARRERYDRWGLACDELSGTVLVIGLVPDDDDTLARSLRLAAAAGEPRVLTLRELRTTTRLACGPHVFTCENPDVLAAAADALGPACPPLVCTEGWPSTACLRLLGALVAGGASAHHHGDMDRDGLRILDHLLAATGGKPWRMTAADHTAHAAGGVRVVLDDPAPVRDPRLHEVAEAIASSGRLVREEQSLATLLSDLRAAGPPHTLAPPATGAPTARSHAHEREPPAPVAHSHAHEREPPAPVAQMHRG